ncbi:MULTISPECIES: DinB family protein [Gracilibacillus]|uniref:DinB family protein n=1 Tax=Gracilibacillus TaxID=74385 RepID=UPI001F205C20|nr:MULTISPECIES: DinB family protein [Gracilibacillus]
MIHLKTIINMYDHLHWANQIMLETLQNTETENSRAIRLFSHILFAETVWLTRMQEQDSSSLPIWQETTIADCKKMASRNQAGFTAFLDRLNETDLDRIITYKNSKEAAFQNSIRDILTHVALHGHYHRGQINADLRTNHHEPVSIDFITFVR